VKHEQKQTNELIAWMFGAVLVGMLLLPMLAGRTEELPKMATAWYILTVVIAIGLGAVGWLILLRKKKDIVSVFSILAAFVVLSGTTALLLTTGIEEWIARVAGMAVAILFYFGYRNVIAKTKEAATNQETWEREAKKAYRMSTFFFLCVLIFGAGKITAILTPIAAVIIFIVVACYDAWAVWKSKTMVEMAKGFVKNGVLPGIAVAKKKKGEIALLGGGDVFFVILVAGVMWKISFTAMVLAAIGMVAAIVALFYYSRPKKHYPAIPFMLAGFCTAMTWFIYPVVPIVLLCLQLWILGTR